MSSADQPAARQDAANPEYGSTTYSWYVVAVLMVMGLFSYLDRQIIVLLIDPIRRDLGISDVQISLLTGFAFGLLYATCGLPLAWVADRFSRRVLIFFGVSFWGLATAACGLANNFTQLFLGRVGVGTGEATLYPASYSIAGDIFPPKRLAFALSVMATGSLIGIGLSFALGGVIAAIVKETHTVTVPLLGEIRTWQAAFIAVGLPGPLLALLMFTVREPKRTNTKASAKALSDGSDKFVSFLKFRRNYFIPYTAGYGLLSLGLYAVYSWGPTYMLRVFDWGGAFVGTAFGIATVSGAGLGFIGGGALIDHLYQRGMKDAHVRVYAYTALLGTPILFGAIALHNPWAFVAGLFVWNLLINGFSAAGFAAMQLISPNAFRARITAIFLFVSNLIGFGLGPLFVAMVTDYVFKDDKMVGWSLAVVLAFVYPAAAIVLFRAAKVMRKIQAEMA